jgi:hypothetical protein
MNWPTNMPFSVKDDFYINRSNYNNMKDMKVEATLAITFAIAEGSYQTAEDIAFSWIDLDHFYNKLGKAHMVEQFLIEYLNFTKQAIDRIILKTLQKMGNKL